MNANLLQTQDVKETFAAIGEYVESINYAIFYMGASNDDNFNEIETRKHLFKLWELTKRINQNDTKTD